MSEELREAVRAAAVEEVRQHLELSEKTTVKASFRNTLIIIGAIICGTWSAAWLINSTLHGLESSTDRIELSLRYKVSQTEFISWATALDKANRSIAQGGLNVPDPTQYMPSQDDKK